MHGWGAMQRLHESAYPWSSLYLLTTATSILRSSFIDGGAHFSFDRASQGICGVVVLYGKWWCVLYIMVVLCNGGVLRDNWWRQGCMWSRRNWRYFQCASRVMVYWWLILVIVFSMCVLAVERWWQQRVLWWWRQRRSCDGDSRSYWFKLKSYYRGRAWRWNSTGWQWYCAMVVVCSWGMVVCSTMVLFVWSDLYVVC